MLTQIAKEVGEEVTATIKKRTQQGKNALGGAFTKYSKSYSAYKMEKKFPKGKGLGKKNNFTLGGDLKVDLLLTGQMLGNLTSKAEIGKGKVTAKVYFPDGKQANKAKKLQEGKKPLMGSRKFMGLTPKEKQALVKSIKKRIIGELIK